MKPFHRLLSLTALALAVACDDGSSESLAGLPIVDDAALETHPLDLDLLTRQALISLHEEQGVAALRNATTELRALDRAARAARSAGDDERALGLMRSLRAEQMRLVVEIGGANRATGALSLAAGELALVRGRVTVAHRAGRDVTRAVALADSAELQLQVGDEAQSPEEQLGAAVAAGAALVRANAVLRSVARLQGIEELFGAALGAIREEHGADAARAIAADVFELTRAAHRAGRAQDAVNAQALLNRARAEQLRAIERGLGAATMREAVLNLIATVEWLQAENRSGRSMDARLLASALDLAEQARGALRDGDTRRAYDRAAHAIGIVEALRSSF